jgi:murein DD-endopeptidase MepM/ murein hydrolase activator NlpD
MMRRGLRVFICLFLTGLIALTGTGKLPIEDPDAIDSDTIAESRTLTICLQPFRLTTRALAVGQSIMQQAAWQVFHKLAGLSTADIYLDAGDSCELVLKDSDISRPVFWSSSNPAAATVNQIGLVSAAAAGSTTIAARSEAGEFLRLCTVRVSEPQAVLADGTYLLQIDGRNRCLTTDQDKSGSYVSITSYDLLKTQAFRFENIGSNRYRIRSARSNTGLLLDYDPAAAPVAAGRPIRLNTDVLGRSSQFWTVTLQWNGLFSIQPDDDPSLALCWQEQLLPTQSAMLAEYSPAEKYSQHWELVPVSPVPFYDDDGCWPLPADKPFPTWMWPVPSLLTVSENEPVNIAGFGTVNIRQDGQGSIGALVVAAQNGKVTFRGKSEMFGMSVIVKSVIAGTTYCTLYGNLINFDSPIWIRAGSYIHKGDIIGRVGTTGPSGQAGLTFGLKTIDETTGIDTPQNPLTRIRCWNQKLAAPDLRLAWLAENKIALEAAAAGENQSSLYLTVSIAAIPQMPEGSAAQIARLVYSRLPVSPGTILLDVQTHGLLPLRYGQQHELIIELEDLSTGRSRCLRTALIVAE